MSRRTLAAAVAGGLLAGAGVGAGEALAAWMHAHGAGELPAFGWALAVYGAVGAAAGLGTGLLAMLVGGDGFALAVAGVGAVLGCVVTRFRVIRDVFLEQAPHGTVALLVQAGALVLIAGLAAAIWFRLRGAGPRGRMLTRPGIAALLVAVLAAGASGAARLVQRESPAPTIATPGGPSGSRPNVILIIVDTLRADHLSAYGYAGVHTKSIDGLATDGVRFANTFAQASWTRPSIATVLTGLYPSSHGAVHKADSLPDRVDTLAEVLAAGGYYTAGFADNANISPAFNFAQGFAEYHYLAPALFFGASETAAQLTLYSGLRLIRERFLARAIDVHNYYQPAEVVTAEVQRWLGSPAARGGPFFLFIHYMDPHDPYCVHPFNGECYARVSNPNPPREVAEKYLRLYDGEIAYLDEQLGVLFADLRARGLYDTSLIVLTGDHGEEFQEHGGWWHGTTLYDEQLHVPLLAKPPRAEGITGQVVEELTTSLDIAPTILTAAHLPVPAAMQGRVLALAAPAAGPTRDSVFAEEDFEGNVLQAVRTRDWKLITANRDNPRGLRPEELYDIGRDRGEQQDVTSRAPGELEMLRAALGRSVLEARAHAGAGQQHEVDSVTQDRLRALGYVN
jgi:arylsulfatase A-like enzyme